MCKYRWKYPLVSTEYINHWILWIYWDLSRNIVNFLTKKKINETKIDEKSNKYTKKTLKNDKIRNNIHIQIILKFL